MYIRQLGTLQQKTREGGGNLMLMFNKIIRTNIKVDDIRKTERVILNSEPKALTG